MQEILKRGTQKSTFCLKANNKLQMHYGRRLDSATAYQVLRNVILKIPCKMDFLIFGGVKQKKEIEFLSSEIFRQIIL